MGTQLVELDLRDNLISIIPTWLSRQRRLWRLVLRGNNVKYLPRTLAHCPALKQLDLARNPQLQVSPYHTSLTSLAVLHPSALLPLLTPGWPCSCMSTWHPGPTPLAGCQML